MLSRQLSASKKLPTAPAIGELSKEGEKTKMKTKKKKQSTRRSPLQNLNGIFRNNGSNSSTTSSIMSIEAPRGCIRSLLSGNPSSSFTKTRSGRPPESVSNDTQTPKSAPNAVRPSRYSFYSSSTSRSKPSKENALPKSTLQKTKEHPPSLPPWRQSCKKLSSRTAPNVGISPFSGNKVKDPASGSEEFGQNLKHLWQQNEQQPERDARTSSSAVAFVEVSDKLRDLECRNVDDFRNCTPVGKLARGSAIDCAINDNAVGEESNTSTTSSKTPPVQVSVSPEIQCGGSSTLISAATPVCYGAGHVVSGVTDRRKCRPLGILRGGNDDSIRCGEATKVFDGGDDWGVLLNSSSRASLVPSPAEASMHWLISPRDEEDVKEQKGGENCPGELVDCASLDLLGTPSSDPQLASDLCNSVDCSSTNHTDTSMSGRKTRIILLKPRKSYEFQGFSGLSSNKVACPSLSASPRATSDYRSGILHEEQKKMCDQVGACSPSFVDSLDSGNVIRTPISDSSLDAHVEPSSLKADHHHKRYFESALDSVADVHRSSSLFPGTKMSLWNQPGLKFQLTDLTSTSDSIEFVQLQKTLDNIYFPTIEKVSQSPTRISWREGLVTRIFDTDDFDSCRWLSDEDDDTGVFTNEDPISYQCHEMDAKLKNDQHMNTGFGSPEFLENEPDIKGKAKLSSDRSNCCVESICTDGGGLVASGDSDWTLCYKNQLFQS